MCSWTSLLKVIFFPGHLLSFCRWIPKVMPAGCLQFFTYSFVLNNIPYCDKGVMLFCFTIVIARYADKHNFHIITFFAWMMCVCVVGVWLWVQRTSCDSSVPCQYSSAWHSLLHGSWGVQLLLFSSVFVSIQPRTTQSGTHYWSRLAVSIWYIIWCICKGYFIFIILVFCLTWFCAHRRYTTRKNWQKLLVSSWMF